MGLATTCPSNGEKLNRRRRFRDFLKSQDDGRRGAVAGGRRSLAASAR